MSPRICAVVPSHNHGRAVGAVVAALTANGLPVLLIDDGSDEPVRRTLSALQGPGVTLHRFERNRGKGEAVMQGLRMALAQGFTHALQIDADGQHDTADIPRLLDVSRHEPAALVLGQPLFDETAPKSRRRARKITHVLCAIECGSLRLGDPLCGFRVYPIEASLAVGTVGRKMDFDPEVAVRLFWRGAPVVHVPVKVRYFTAAEGGVSHYQLVRDTGRLAWMHVRLCTGALFRALTWPVRRLGGRGA